jgi:hypothetical protein
METNRRRGWIIVVGVLVIACCCVLAAAAAAVAWLTPWSVDWGGISSNQRETVEETFEVGNAPSLEIDNFAGSITVRAGEGNTIRVVATKQARSQRSLERIQVEMDERDGGILIWTRKPASLMNASVRLEIVAPAGTRLDAHTGSGSVDVRGLGGDVRVDTGSGSVDVSDLGDDVTVHTGSGSVEVRAVSGDVTVDTGSGSITMNDVVGEIDAHTGSGSMDVRQAEGRVRLDTGSGSIKYDGVPEDDCRFETGSGGITLMLPDNLNMEVDLGTGSGRVDVEFAVEGEISKREVEGTVGDGSQGSIYAHTNSGDIDVLRR